MTARRGRPRDNAARKRILTAASKQFVDNGFTTTTMTGIASEADVAVQTLYHAFGSKVGLLSAVHDVALAGDDEPVPVLERDWVLKLVELPTVADGWAWAVDHQLPMTVRVASVYAAIQGAAADPAAAELLARLRAERSQHCHEVAALLVALPGVNDDADVESIADVLYALICPESYALFVTERGWSIDRWRSWIHDTVLNQLSEP